MPHGGSDQVLKPYCSPLDGYQAVIHFIQH
jgi:hypothetical protein